MSAPHRPVHLGLGVAFMAAATACFASLDTATKVAALTIPIVMSLWFRYAFQTVATVAVLVPLQGRRFLKVNAPRLQLLRGASITASSVITFLSVRHLPIAEFTAIVMLTPVATTIVAAMMSRDEHVSVPRWVLMIGGFVGAAMVIGPGSLTLGWNYLLPIISIGTNTTFQIVTSRLTRYDSPGTMHFYTGLFGTAAMSILLPFAWTPLGVGSWLLILLTGVLASVGHLMLIFAYTRAPVSALAPYQYLQVAFAMLGGVLIFDHLPTPVAIAGIVLIAACGAATTWLTGRERARQHAREPGPTEAAELDQR